MENKVIFTTRRRDLLAKTIMDINKVIVAAAFANEFFLKYGFWITSILIFMIILFALSGIFICPKGDE